MNTSRPSPLIVAALVGVLLAVGAACRPARAAEATGQALLVVEDASQASVERGGTRQALVPGAVLVEQDLVRVGPGGRATLRLARHGFADLGPDTEVGIERLPFASFAGDLRSVFSLGQGYLRVVWKHPQLSTAWPLYVYLSGQRMGLANGEYFFSAQGGQQWACLAAGQLDLTPLGGEGAPSARPAEILRPSACYLLQPGGAPRVVAVAPSAWTSVRRSQTLIAAVDGGSGGALAAVAVPVPVPIRVPPVTYGATGPGTASPALVGPEAPALSSVPAPNPGPVAYAVPYAPGLPRSGPAQAIRPEMLSVAGPVVAPMVATPAPPTPRPMSMPVAGSVPRSTALATDPNALPALYVPPPPPVVAPPGTWVPLQPTSAVVVPAYADPEDSYFSLTSAEAARASADPAPAMAPATDATGGAPAEPVAGEAFIPAAPPESAPAPAPAAAAVTLARGTLPKAAEAGLSGWSITYAVTPDPDAARAVQTQLLTHGTPAVVVPARPGGETRYRVQQRGFASQREARTALARGPYPGATVDKG